MTETVDESESPERLREPVAQDANLPGAGTHSGGDPELLALGWERRFVADAARAAEAEELYRRLGFEVRTEPARPEELSEGCDDCLLSSLLAFKTIYTRAPRPKKLV